MINETMSSPDITVCLIAYNHEKFIRDTFEGILEQRNIDFEIIVGEDCSTDNTRKICDQYAAKYDFIKILTPPKNIGVIPNIENTLKLANGKYIALCEGDDYWIDPYKLQKQKNFLDENEEFVLVYHNVIALNIDYSKKNREDAKKIFFQKKPHEIPVGHRTHTSSMFFRNKLITIPKSLHDVVNGDTVLHFLLNRHGSIEYLDNIYPNIRRRHKNSIYSYSCTESKHKRAINLQKRLLNISITRREKKNTKKKLVKSQSRYLDYLSSSGRSIKKEYLKQCLIHSFKNQYLLVFLFFHFIYKKVN